MATRYGMYYEYLRFWDELAYAVPAGGLAVVLIAFVADPGHLYIVYFWLAFLLFFHAGLRFFLRWMLPLTLI